MQGRDETPLPRGTFGTLFNQIAVYLLLAAAILRERTPAAMTEKTTNRLWQRLGRYFIAGVFAVLPLVITVLAVSWVIGFLLLKQVSW